MTSLESKHITHLYKQGWPMPNKNSLARSKTTAATANKKETAINHARLDNLEESSTFLETIS